MGRALRTLGYWPVPAGASEVTSPAPNPALRLPNGGPVWIFLAACLLTLVFLTSVHLFLTSGTETNEPGIPVAASPSAPARKLVVLVVDGLRPEDARDERLAFLKPFRDHGFVAEIEPCLERQTVPCVSEAFMGTATAGLLGVYHNLVSAGTTVNSSVFSDVVDSGRTTAVVHEKEYSAYSRSLTRDWHGDSAAGWAHAKQYIGEGIDLVVWHYPFLDEVAHHFPVGTPKYDAAIRRLNDDGEALVAALPPEYRLVVCGDHGHSLSGRHIFGLNIPTVFLSDGELFGNAPVKERLPISTYRFLVGAELGLLPPANYEGANLADRLPEGSELRAVAERQTYVGTVRRGISPVWVAIAALLIGGLAVRTLPAPMRGYFAGGLALAGVVGLIYLRVLPTIHYSPTFPWVRGPILGVAMVGGIGGYPLRRDGRGLVVALLLFGMVLPATIYNYGIFQSGANLIALATLGLALPSLYRLGPLSRRRWLEVVLLVAAIVGAVYELGDIQVGTFTIKNFPHLRDLPTAVGCLLWAGFAAALPTGRVAKVVAALVAGVGASGLVHVGDYPLAAITAGVLVAALRFPAALPAIGAWAAVPWYGRSDSMGVVAVVLLAAAAARLASSDAQLRRWLIPAIAVLGGYLSLAHSARLRSNGLDFAFAIRWLPGDLHFKLWPIVGLALLVKVLLPPALVVLGVERFAGDVGRTGACAAVCVRLAAISAEVAGMLFTTDAPPPYRLFEQLEDMLAWLLVLGTLLLVSRGRGTRTLVGAPVLAGRD